LDEQTAGIVSANQAEPTAGSVAFEFVKALAEDDVTAAMMSRVITAEPALSARILHLANSAALNPGRKPITSLQSAVSRVGFNVVRLAAISFAIAQVRQNAELKGLQSQLDALWESSTTTAATAFAIARRLKIGNADEALLAGLLCGIGRLYILVKSRSFPALFDSPEVYAEIVESWHAEVARAILENWGIPEFVVDAVHRHQDLDYEHEGATDLVDTLIVANIVAQADLRGESADEALGSVAAARRMQLGADDWRNLLLAAHDEVREMKAALGA